MHNEYFYTKKDINEFKIALISDIHYYSTYNKKIFDNLYNQMKENKPNYIAITGDILDSSDTKDLNSLHDFLNNIAKLAPVIVVLGNHDEKQGHMHHWSHKKSGNLIELLNSINNLHLLNDSKYQDNNITFYGFKLSYNHYEVENESYESFCNEIKDLKFDIPKSTYNITLLHTPVNIYNFIKKNPNHPLSNSDLILSGHMHNGCLPFWMSHTINKLFKTTRGILSPTRTFFPKFSHGRNYERNGYIFEGICKLSHSTKFLHNFDCFFQKKVEFITIKKDR